VTPVRFPSPSRDGDREHGMTHAPSETIAPLRLQNATGSPVNPIAVF
jgi:hypothetical protein